jgi:hypothetical protein
MRVTFEIPDEHWWKIAARAEGLYGQRVDEYASDVLIAVAASRAPVETDPVVRLWREGLPDREVGNLLGLTVSQVKGRRVRYGLPANRKHRSVAEDFTPVGVAS